MIDYYDYVYDLVIWEVWKVKSKTLFVFQPTGFAHVHPESNGIIIASYLILVLDPFGLSSNFLMLVLNPMELLSHLFQLSPKSPPILIVKFQMLKQDSYWLGKPSDVPVTKDANVGHCSGNMYITTGTTLDVP